MKPLFFVVLFVLIGYTLSWWLAFGLLSLALVVGAAWLLRGDASTRDRRAMASRHKHMTLEQKAIDAYGRSLSDGATESLFDE